MSKGFRLFKGYVQSRIMHNGAIVSKSFGPDSSLAREYALKWYLDQKHEIRMGKFGIVKELSSKRFSELVPIYMKMWAGQKDGDGRAKHSQKAITERQRVFDSVLCPFFGDILVHNVRTVDIEKWREKRLETGVLGTSVNREMVPLGDFFSELAVAIAVERIEPFKMPAENPCKKATKASMRKRTRLVTDYELRKLHFAFTTLEDNDGWEICKLALKSIMSEKDLRKLELGSTIDTERSKTGVPVHLPITVLQKLNWHNWRKRWEAAREEAGTVDIQFRDLRKKGGNYLVGRKHDMKLISQYHGHASIKTTEQSYALVDQEKMRPLAEDLETWVEGL